jgi:hypothetical protein
MDTVTSEADIDRNLRLLEETWAAGPTSSHFNTYRTLIARGRCFIPYTVDDRSHFAPSRFVGYKKVNFKRHSEAEYLDGKLTNPAISRALGVALVEDERLDAAYKRFLVDDLGYSKAVPNNQRKFWLTDTAISVLTTLDLDQEQSEFDGVPETVRQAMVKARIGQVKFREALIKYWQGCAFTNCRLFAVLKASHIKPWRASSDEERLDPWNGLLLTPNLDALFDAGWISFGPDGALLLARSLPKAERALLVPESSKLIKISAKHEHYLQYHRSNIFKG